MKITNRLKIALKSMLDVRLGKVATDKAELIFDGEELAVGTEVFVAVADSEDVAPAEDGEYVAEDGRTFVIAEGKVAEIKEKEEEVDTNLEDETPAPADEPENPVDEEPAEEDKIAALEAKLAEMTEALNGIVNSLAALEGRMNEIEGKLAKVEAPAADPVDETSVEENAHKTRMSYLKK